MKLAVVSVTQVMMETNLSRSGTDAAGAGSAAFFCALFGALLHERLSGFLLVCFLLLHALRHNLPPVMVE